jgi:hypothetical protein
VIHSDPFWIILLRLIQLNWVVLAYNFNLEKGANNLRVKFRCISAYSLTTTLPCYYYLAYHFIPSLAEYKP